MVVPMFGWSAGDIVVSIKIVYVVADALRDSTKAQDQYVATSTWLNAFASDLNAVREYITQHPEARYASNLAEQMANINEPYSRFEQYLEKFDAAFNSQSDASRVTRAAKRVVWSFKELNERCQRLQEAVSGPLTSLNLLLSLQKLDDVNLLSQRLGSLSTQELEHGFIRLQQSLKEQMTLLQGLRKTAAEEGTAQTAELVRVHESIIAVTRSALQQNTTATNAGTMDIGCKLDSLTQQSHFDSATLEDQLQEQRLNVLACQTRLELVLDATEDIRRQLPDQSSISGEKWIDGLRTAGIAFAVLTGAVNLLQVQKLQEVLRTYPTKSARPQTVSQFYQSFSKSSDADWHRHRQDQSANISREDKATTVEANSSSQDVNLASRQPAGVGDHKGELLKSPTGNTSGCSNGKASVLATSDEGKQKPLHPVTDYIKLSSIHNLEGLQGFFIGDIVWFMGARHEIISVENRRNGWIYHLRDIGEHLPKVVARVSQFDLDLYNRRPNEPKYQITESTAELSHRQSPPSSSEQVSVPHAAVTSHAVTDLLARQKQDTTQATPEELPKQPDLPQPAIPIQDSPASNQKVHHEPRSYGGGGGGGVGRRARLAAQHAPEPRHLLGW